VNELGILSVTEAIEVVNKTFALTLPRLEVEGEVSGFSVNQGKFVFFSLVDGESSIKCFMMLFNMNIQIEDGMNIRVEAQPSLHKRNGFSLNVQQMTASGEGSLKRAFELTKKKLESEGLFAAEKKRPLPEFPVSLGLITSSGAAAYTDITKILSQRWPLLEVTLADTVVQGDKAPASIIESLKQLNSTDVELIIIARGGGSLEDLAAFNDEQVARALAASRKPTVVGVGHERDISLVGLVADVRATTPTNAAQLATPDANVIRDRLRALPKQLINFQKSNIQSLQDGLKYLIGGLSGERRQLSERLDSLKRSLIAHSPSLVLAKGYAIVSSIEGDIVRGPKDVSGGDIIKAKFRKGYIISEVKDGR